MATTKTQEQSAAGLRQELETAERGVEEVLERIKDGDKQVGPEDLEAAERRVRFCEVRLEGARLRGAEEAELERLRALTYLAERTRERVEEADAEKARKAAEKALDRYVAACVEHNASLDEAVDELLVAEALPEGFRVAMGSDGHSPTLAGRTYRRVRPMVSVASMAHEALRRHIRHGYIDLERPY